MLNDVALSISEDVGGANGDLDRYACIERAANQLVDYVFETLAGEYGVGSGTCCPFQIPREAYWPIQCTVAAAMIAQHEYDDELWGAAFALDGIPDDPTMRPAARTFIAAMRGFIKQQQKFRGDAE